MALRLPSVLIGNHFPTTTHVCTSASRQLLFHIAAVLQTSLHVRALPKSCTAFAACLFFVGVGGQRWVDFRNKLANLVSLKGRLVSSFRGSRSRAWHFCLSLPL